MSALWKSDECASMSAFGSKSGRRTNLRECLLLTQSGHGGGSLGHSNGQFSIQKCDILLIPDVVLGAGEAMRRRDFLGIIGCAVTWPVALKAQSTDRVRVIGMLDQLGRDDPESKARTTVFEQTLEQLGWKVGRDLKIETRSVGRDLDLLQPQNRKGARHNHSAITPCRRR